MTDRTELIEFIIYWQEQAKFDWAYARTWRTVDVKVYNLYMKVAAVSAFEARKYLFKLIEMGPDNND